jgi:hypothetical protein
VTYAAPVGIALLLCWLGLRQRIADRWIIAGVCVICVFGAFHVMNMSWSNVPGRSELSLSYALAPPYPTHMIIAGLYRLPLNLLAVAALYFLWLRRRVPTEAD